jgi:hypothetical protein
MEILPFIRALRKLIYDIVSRTTRKPKESYSKRSIETLESYVTRKKWQEKWYISTYINRRISSERIPRKRNTGQER